MSIMGEYEAKVRRPNRSGRSSMAVLSSSVVDILSVQSQGRKLLAPRPTDSIARNNKSGVRVWWLVCAFDGLSRVPRLSPAERFLSLVAPSENGQHL